MLGVDVGAALDATDEDDGAGVTSAVGEAVGRADAVLVACTDGSGLPLSGGPDWVADPAEAIDGVGTTGGDDGAPAPVAAAPGPGDTAPPAAAPDPDVAAEDASHATTVMAIARKPVTHRTTSGRDRETRVCTTAA